MNIEELILWSSNTVLQARDEGHAPHYWQRTPDVWQQIYSSYAGQSIVTMKPIRSEMYGIPVVTIRRFPPMNDQPAFDVQITDIAPPNPQELCLVAISPYNRLKYYDSPLTADFIQDPLKEPQ